MVWGALLDGYNGEGAGFWRSLGEDFLSFGGGSAAAGAAVKGWRILQSSFKTTRVGRWMSQAEYNAMKATGRVQESEKLGTTYFANPANSAVFSKQAARGSIYVEFNVPTSSLKQTGDNWAKILGPKTTEGRYAAQNGLAVPQMPRAKNISILEGKP